MMQQVVAKPVVPARIIESDFKLRPRTIEEVGAVDVLLDEDRDAVGCTKYTQSVNQLHYTGLYCTKNTKHVHVLGLEGRMHDTNTSPKTNCATMIEENIYRSNSRVEQSNNTHMKNHFLRIQTNKPQRAPSKRSLPPSLYINCSGHSLYLQS